MATLQNNRSSASPSSLTARARLKQVIRETPLPSTSIEPEDFAEPVVPAASIAATAAVEPLRPMVAYRARLSELEQHHLLLETVTLYKEWHLISVQHRPESDVLVAHLLHNSDKTDPLVAIREGRTMQIILDAVGDMKVQYARRRQTNFLVRIWGSLFAR